MNSLSFRSGDRVVHPMYGLGVVEGQATRDLSGQVISYYNVRLSDGALLSIPAARAEELGLRRVTNSLAVVTACLHSPALPLADDDRQRALQLKARAQAPQPRALVQAMRDLVHRGCQRNLTPADKRWLSSACDRLSAEVASVDAMDRDQARAALQQEIDACLVADEAATPDPEENRAGEAG